MITCRSILGQRLVALAAALLTTCPAASAQFGFFGTWTYGPDLPTARWGAAAVTGINDGRIYVIGGTPGLYPTGIILGTVDAYDPATKQWSSLPPLPTPRFGLMAVAVPDLFPQGTANYTIWAIGGYSGDPSNPVAVSTVEIFDPNTNRWQSGPDLVTPRAFAGAAFTGTGIYVVGGLTGPGFATSPPLASMEVLPFLGETAWQPAPPMPTARAGLAAVYWPVGTIATPNGAIYAIGGETQGPGFPLELSTVEMFDVAAQTWATVAPMPTARGYLGATLLGSGFGLRGIIAAGGDSMSSSSEAVEIYDPGADTWQAAEPLLVSTTRLAMATGADGNPYVFGGIFILADGALPTVQYLTQDAPVISSVRVTNVGDNTATVSWSTNLPTQGGVDYGPSLPYTNFVSDQVLGFDHSIVLNGLTPGTMYHFDVNASTVSNFVTDSGDMTFTTTGSSVRNVSSLVSVSRGGFRLDRTSGRFVQQVTLTNTGTSAIPGPVSLVLDGLSSNATLFNKSGVTSAMPPTGSPYLDANISALQPGAALTLTLQFTNPTKQGITYSTRVLAGSGSR